MEKYKHLDLEERIQISVNLNLGRSKAEIARLLNRPKSTINREIKRNSGSNYRWTLAQELSATTQRSKHKGSKISKSALLYRFIRFCLHYRMSPEQISRKLSTKYSDHLELQISHESIYTFIYLWCKGELRKELKNHLRYRKYERGKSKSSGKTKVLIPDRVSISERPTESNDRAIAGHWESDLIIGKDGKSAVQASDFLKFLLYLRIKLYIDEKIKDIY